MFMMLEDQYGVGDVIDFEKASGTVEAVGLRTTRLRDVNGTVWYVRNGEVVRVGNKSQGFAQVVLDVPIDAWADVAARRRRRSWTWPSRCAPRTAWAGVFLGDPEVQGVEAMTREETVIRLVARVRPLEQWRVARELRRRIRERLDRLDIGTPADRPTPPPDELAAHRGERRGRSLTRAEQRWSGDRADGLEDGPVQRRVGVVHRQQRRDRHLGVHREREQRRGSRRRTG